MTTQYTSGDTMNVNLGSPYEIIIQNIIKKGYAGNQTEVIRQALMAYARQIEMEEVILVNKGIERDMKDIRSGKMKTYSFEETKKILGV